MRIQLEHYSGSYLIGFAKKKLEAIRGIRLNAKLPLLRKTFELPPHRVIVLSTELGDSILILGIPTLGVEILLGAATGKHTGYLFSSDQLRDGFTLDGVYGPIGQGPNGFMNISGTVEAVYSAGWSHSELSNRLTPLAYSEAYDTAYSAAADNTIYARRLGEQGAVLSLTDTLLPDLACGFGSLVGVSAFKDAVSWNLFRGAILYTISPASASVTDSWYWTPSFFTAQPADGFGLPPGFYYGNYPASPYGVDNDLDSLDVSLKAVCDTRVTSQNGLYNYGWAELVTSVNGESVRDLYVYMQNGPLSVPGNPNFGYLRIAGTTGQQIITTGSDVQGFPASVSYKLSAEANPDIDLWNFRIWTDESATTPTQDTGVGIAITEDRTATFWRFTGFSTKICDSVNYHSHSYGGDGTILAVFESDPGTPTIISRVRVFDLYGVRDGAGVEGTSLREGTNYTAGGVTELRDSAVVAAVEAVNAAVIPFHVDEFEPFEPTYEVANALPAAQPPDYTDFLPSLGIVRFNKAAVTAPDIWKVTCTNGVDASYRKSIDECFDSVMVVEDPRLGVNEERLVGRWDTGLERTTLKGVLRGGFVGDHPSMKFEGEGEEGKIFYEVTRPDEFTMTLAEDGVTVIPAGLIGNFSPGECLIDNGDGTYSFDSNCENIDCDAGGMVATGTSSCGQSSEVFKGFGELTLLGSNVFDDDGRLWTASGGAPPYTWSFNKGTISAVSSTQAEITSLNCGAPGDVAEGTLTVTDSCGNTASIVGQVAGGYWYQIGSEDNPYSECNTGAGCDYDPDVPTYVYGTTYSYVDSGAYRVGTHYDLVAPSPFGPPYPSWADVCGWEPSFGVAPNPLTGSRPGTSIPCGSVCGGVAYVSGTYCGDTQIGVVTGQYWEWRCS